MSSSRSFERIRDDRTHETRRNRFRTSTSRSLACFDRLSLVLGSAPGTLEEEEGTETRSRSVPTVSHPRFFFPSKQGNLVPLLCEGDLDPPRSERLKEVGMEESDPCREELGSIDREPRFPFPHPTLCERERTPFGSPFRCPSVGPIRTIPGSA